MTDVPESVREHRIIMIYRGVTPRHCLELTKILYDAGLRLFEVTLNSERPLESIRLLRDEFGADVRIGAGTVLDPDDVDRVADAGAGFVISPHLDTRVVARTKQAGLVAIPGTFTPTEIVQAVDSGADMVKVFPIRPVGLDYIRQLRGPLPDTPMVATGGVNAELAAGCLREGCVGVGVGAQLLGQQAMAERDSQELSRQARELVAAAKSVP